MGGEGRMVARAWMREVDTNTHHDCIGSSPMGLWRLMMVTEKEELGKVGDKAWNPFSLRSWHFGFFK